MLQRNPTLQDKTTAGYVKAPKVWMLSSVYTQSCLVYTGYEVAYLYIQSDIATDKHQYYWNKMMSSVHNIEHPIHRGNQSSIFSINL
jgi:hypothetical protein